MTKIGIKQQVKQGKMTAGEAIKTLTLGGASDCHTLQWLKRRVNKPATEAAEPVKKNKYKSNKQ